MKLKYLTTDRGAHFALVFFDSFAALWTDGATQLARATLISHLVS